MLASQLVLKHTEKNYKNVAIKKSNIHKVAFEKRFFTFYKPLTTRSIPPTHIYMEHLLTFSQRI